MYLFEVVAMTITTMMIMIPVMKTMRSIMRMKQRIRGLRRESIPRHRSEAAAPTTTTTKLMMRTKQEIRGGQRGLCI
jgi:hypothetical protein